MIRILVVEDDKAISDLICFNLKRSGYNPVACFDGTEAEELLERDSSFDLILLDVMLPGADGFEIMEYTVAPLEIPVIFITAKSSTIDRIKGLTSGADDYIVKPFEIVELLARVNIVLRRYHKAESVLSFKNITIDVENRIVKTDNVIVELTPKEYDLFLFLVRNKNITLFRDKIYEKVWESDFDQDTRTLDLHIRRIRQKLGLSTSLKTIYGMGYRLEDTNSDEV